MSSGAGSSSGSQSAESARSVTPRWRPTAEQKRYLESLYARGIRTPTDDEINQITAHLRMYGSVEGKNVFYWFQNYSAREKQKLINDGAQADERIKMHRAAVQRSILLHKPEAECRTLNLFPLHPEEWRDNAEARNYSHNSPTDYNAFSGKSRLEMNDSSESLGMSCGSQAIDGFKLFPSALESLPTEGGMPILRFTGGHSSGEANLQSQNYNLSLSARVQAQDSPIRAYSSRNHDSTLSPRYFHREEQFKQPYEGVEEVAGARNQPWNDKDESPSDIILQGFCWNPSP